MLYLFFAIILEVIGTTCMKLSVGLTHFFPSILMILFYIASFLSLALALKTIDVSTGYAIWSGVGTALIAFIGIMLFKESVSVLKIVGIASVMIGVVAINIAK